MEDVFNHIVASLNLKRRLGANEWPVECEQEILSPSILIPERISQLKSEDECSHTCGNMQLSCLCTRTKYLPAYRYWYGYTLGGNPTDSAPQRQHDKLSLRYRLPLPDRVSTSPQGPLAPAGRHGSNVTSYQATFPPANFRLFHP